MPPTIIPCRHALPALLAYINNVAVRLVDLPSSADHATVRLVDTPFPVYYYYFDTYDQFESFASNLGMLMSLCDY